MGQHRDSHHTRFGLPVELAPGIFTTLFGTTVVLKIYLLKESVKIVSYQRVHTVYVQKCGVMLSLQRKEITVCS
jgi:hypothetical protein